MDIAYSLLRRISPRARRHFDRAAELETRFARLVELAREGKVDPEALTARVDAEVAREEARAKLREGELARLRRMGNRKLHLGCGNYAMDGWTNIDGGDGIRYDPPSDPRVVKMDVFEALAAIADDSVEFIHSEQFFEHFTRQEGHRLMRECRRVLRPGGVMRTQVPDLLWTVKLYLDQVDFAPWDTVQYPHRIRHIGGTTDPYGKLIDGEAYLPSMMVNNSFQMDGHKFLYDYATLAQTLRLAGFAQVEQCAYGVSRHAELHGIDHHDGGETGRAFVPRIALTAESTK